MEVRQANVSDVAEINGLFERCYPVLMRASYEPEVLAVALPTMIKANPELIASGRFYVVDEDSKIVGCGGWSVETPGTGAIIAQTAHIRHFAVDPDFGRRGIGRVLYEKCKNEAVKAGMLRFQAFSSLNAEPFYQSMGLSRLDQHDIPMGEVMKFPIVHMQGEIA